MSKVVRFEEDNRRRMPSATLKIPAASRLRNISVDALLANVGEVPSARKRGGGGVRSRADSSNESAADHRRGVGGAPTRSSSISAASTSGGSGPDVTAGSIKAAPDRRIPKQNIPQRTSKTSQKLVLLPENNDISTHGYDVDVEDDGPPRPAPVRESKRSVAERMPKESRHEHNLPRVTAYCTCEAYRLHKAAVFLRKAHVVKPRIYDECLYAAYHLPLLPGDDDSGCRVQSSPQVRDLRGEDILDRQIDRTELRDHTRDWENGRRQDNAASVAAAAAASTASKDGDQSSVRQGENATIGDSDVASESDESTENRGRASTQKLKRRDSLPTADDMPAMYKHAELFLFSYGTIVFWNFTETQERDILADLTFADNGTLMSRPLRSDDLETEEFHFEYSPRTHAPRIFNDMITLRSGDHFIKLAMSHALSQSVKLSLFEERMASNLEDAQGIPRKLALTGELGMTQDSVLKMSGRLFKQRVDVNLSSNVLDTPEFFWDSEPSLHPLYAAFREYLEIGLRILVLNEKCRVVFDLIDILADSIADSKMNRITWIVIYLILLSIIVTIFEVVIRFLIIVKTGH